MNTTTEKHRKREVGGAVIGTLVGVVVVGLLFLIVQTYGVTSSIRENQKSSKSTLAAIESCTKPTGECYREGQRRTAAAVGDITQISTQASIFAAACAAAAPDPVTVEFVQSCTMRRLAAWQRHNLPQQ